MKSKKDLKEAYQQRKPTMGVFQIRNTVNGKVLLDGSLNIRAKWNRIRTELKFGTHRNKALQQDWNTQGEADFEFSVYATLEVKEGEAPNLAKDLQLLTEMTREELGLDAAMLY
ncbi:MAG: GIY-YIG nuclease family protein [Lewinella sp.]|nr:GIY-YIG nuclease family protein [Lewinella sp.]